MNKSNLIKLFSILLISIMLIMFTTNVLAAEDGNNAFRDLTGTVNTQNNTPSNLQNNTTNNTLNNTTNNSRNNVSSNLYNNTNSSSSNSSMYNNTNLPKTGIEDSIPVAMLVVVFGISAIYAYKKIKEYRNI